MSFWDKVKLISIIWGGAIFFIWIGWLYATLFVEGVLLQKSNEEISNDIKNRVRDLIGYLNIKAAKNK